jgi:thiol:disulfide interchange protein DsbD
VSFSLDQIEVTAAQSDLGPSGILPLAFVAGLLLNLMPCVLPVVGLSFSRLCNSQRQSTASSVAQRRLLRQLMSVMLVLATFAVFAVWAGAAVQQYRFSVTLAAIVFAFGWSFLTFGRSPRPGCRTAGGGAMAARSARAC